MNIEIKKIQKKHMNEVIDMLHKNMSEYIPPEEKLNEIWNFFSSQSNVHALVATIDDIVVGYGSIVIETKIRGGKTGHIEDIVSHSSYREKGIGKTIVSKLTDIAKKKGCYKVALLCKEHNIDFYKSCLQYMVSI